MNEKTTGGGIGFCGVLTIVFIILKLCKVIAWHWAWVLAPLWIPLALGCTIFLVWVIGVCLISLFEK